MNDRLQQMIKELKQLQLALIKFDIELNKDFKNFTDGDWKAVDELLYIYQGKIKPKNENTWHMWWWQGKVVPFFLAIDPNGELCIENGICFKHLKISVGSEGKRYFVPPFILFKRDIWEKLYDVAKEISDRLLVIDSEADDIKVICAVNILLENRRKAKRNLDEMSYEDKELFMTFPIYNLL